MAGKGVPGNWGNRSPNRIPTDVSAPTQVKPGEKRNPTGKGGHASSIRRELQESAELLISTSTGKQVTRKEAMVTMAWKLALEGDLRAIMFITEQIDGKLTDKIHLSGADGGPIEVVHRVVYEDTPIGGNGDASVN